MSHPFIHPRTAEELEEQERRRRLLLEASGTFGSVRAFAKAMDMSEGQCSRLVRGEQRVSDQTMERYEAIKGVV